MRISDGSSDVCSSDLTIFQFASIGAAPQDKKYAGEPTRLEIGDRNTIREFVTFNIGTSQDVGVTRMGHDNWIMADVHLSSEERRVGKGVAVRVDLGGSRIIKKKRR